MGPGKNNLVAPGINVEAVRTHLRNIYEKLHVRTRTEAVLRYLGK